MRRGRLLALAAILLALVAVGVLMRERRTEPASPPSASDSSLLVVTWGPSLCKVESSIKGCRSGRVGSLGQSFVLHGLWPQPKDQQYCGVPKNSRDRKEVPLPPDLQARLKSLMSDSSVMAPHEWYAHGSCSGVTPTEYFSIATTLADQAIAVLDPVFDRQAGGRINARSVREAVDAQFGSGAGARVALACKDAGGGPVVYEVRLSLPPVARLRPDPPSLAEALAAAPAVPPGCGQGRLP